MHSCVTDTGSYASAAEVIAANEIRLEFMKDNILFQRCSFQPPPTPASPASSLRSSPLERQHSRASPIHITTAARRPFTRARDERIGSDQLKQNEKRVRGLLALLLRQ